MRRLTDYFGATPGRKILGLCATLVMANVGTWVWALITFRERPVLTGTAVLAYVLGLRHAFDADHIAAIDNVTRKLMAEGRRPVSVGLFFSLGHSTVVVALSLVIALTTGGLQERFDLLRSAGGVIGTLVSSSFLFAVAFANLGVLVSVHKTFDLVRRGGRFVESELDADLANRGLLVRLIRPLVKVITRSWQMYPLGLMFGLGFDTATEVGVLGIAATQATNGVSVWSIMVFPALFTAGMTLADTTESLLMLGAYEWALVRPVRKLYYNLTITALSVLIAFLIGSVEMLGLVADRLALDGPVWRTMRDLNENLGVLGYLIFAIFLVGWTVSYVIYRVRGYDRIET